MIEIIKLFKLGYVHTIPQLILRNSPELEEVVQIHRI